MKSLIKVLVLLGAPLLAFGGSKVAPDLPQSDPNATVDVIIQYKTPPSKDELKQLGPYGQIKKIYSVINGVNIALTVKAIQQISTDPNVAYITPNRKSQGAVDISTGSVNANLVWSYGYDGTGVGVAVIDSGITLKNDLKNAAGVSRVVYNESFVPGVTDPSDAYGHGTHVAGIIGGDGASSTGLGFTRTFKGMAPNANLINLRVLDQNGIRKLYTRSALSGRRVGMESRDRGGSCGRQLRTRQFAGNPRLRHNCFAWQRSLRDHSRGHQRKRDNHAG